MTAVIYSRISDDPTGKAAGVERQTDECEALASARAIDVLEVIVDNDLSATSGKRRPGFERVLELIRAGAVDTVIVWHTDRLYRLPRDLEPLIDLADARPLRFLTVTASEIDLNTSSGRMVARILAAASAAEVEHKAERQRSASDQRASRGGLTARPGYGYRRVDGVDVVDEEEAATIREATSRILGGDSLRTIARDFNSRGIPSPASAEWEGVTVRRALARPSLAGLRVHRGVVVGRFATDLHPAILTEDEHARLVALFADPARRTSPGTGRAPRHLLSGLAVCGREGCGEVLYRTVGWTPKPGSKARHAIPAAYTCKACGIRRAQAPVDDLVTELVIRRLERADAADLFTQQDEEVARDAREAIAAIEARLATAADSFAEGAIDGEQLRRITATLRAKRAEHEAVRAAALPPAIPLDAIGEHARASWESYGLDRRRAIISTLMRVTVLPSGAGQRTFDPELIRIEWLSDTQEGAVSAR